MLKKTITPLNACDLLNEFLALDPECAQALMFHREKCNDTLASHPTIQVQQYIDDKFPKVGLLGLINGMFGVRDDGRGAICAIVDDTGKITGFKLTPPPYTEY